MWWMAWVSCALTVDFDPDTEGTQDTSGPMDPPDGVTTPVDTSSVPEGVLPTLVLTTECHGGAPPEIPAANLDVDTEVITQPTTFDDGPIDRVLAFASHSSVEVVGGAVSSPTVVPPSSSAVFTFAERAGSDLILLSLCTGEKCPSSTLRVVLPQPVSVVVAATGEGNVTVEEAATSDVWAETESGAVLVRGDVSGIRAVALGGTSAVEAPQAQIVDVFSDTGPVTFRGSATHEFCAQSIRGDLDVELLEASLVSLRTTDGDMVADVASRTQELELQLSSGSANVALPGGAYRIDMVSGPDADLTLEGITEDDEASERITGRSLGTGTLLRAR